MTALLFSTHPDLSLQAQLDRLSSLPPLEPFSEPARSFVEAFSRRILKLPELRQFPELATLAHWFRPAAIQQMSRHVLDKQPGSAFSRRGLVFHLAPANVDALFAYAWLLSVLCGNNNVARLSQKESAQRDVLIGILDDMHAAAEFTEVLARTVLITYPHDAAVTASISLKCHARIIWGGDQTVSAIRAVPLAPLAIEIAFPDRFGVAALKADVIKMMSPESLNQFSHRFCNDMLWFSQQACSSPRSLYWVGTNDDISDAKQRFWPAVRRQSVNFQDEPAALMARITDSHLLAAAGYADVLEDDLSCYPLRLAANVADARARELQSGYGLLLEASIGTLTALAQHLDDRDQTLVQHGFDRAELAGLVNALSCRALDRIVPVGRALDFHHVWDGVDLFRVLTRQTTLPSN